MLKSHIDSTIVVQNTVMLGNLEKLFENVIQKYFLVHGFCTNPSNITVCLLESGQCSQVSSVLKNLICTRV